MNIKYLVSTVIVASAFSASASQILFATGGTRGHLFATNSGTRLAVDSLVRVGYLTTANDLSTFTEFAQTTISNPGPNAPFNIGGYLTRPAENLVTGNNVGANAAKGKQIYLWVYNSATISTTAEQGIFTSTDPSWIFPTFTGDPTETNDPATSLMLALGAVTALSPLDQVNKPNWTPPTSTKGTISIGSTASDNANGSIYRLGAVIPEPGTAGLLLLSLAGLARRRR